MTDRRRMVDRDQIAVKLQVRRRDYQGAIEARPAMPKPTGYYRGRVLWDEAQIDTWITAQQPTLKAAAAQD